MGFSNLYLLLISTIIMQFMLLVSAKNETSTTSHSKNQIVNVGLILDFNSSAGYMTNSCISMALSNFYAKNQHYTTRLALHYKDSRDILTATSAALELVNKDRVVAIIGPQNSNEAGSVAEIGEKSQVPILSFSMTRSSHRPSQNPYFIQTTLPDSSQLECITSLLQQLEWHEIVVIYQNDTQEEAGNFFIPRLIDTLQKGGIKLSYVIAISSSASVSDHIMKELNHIRSLKTRVFLVHVTSPDLVSRLFSLANEAGMMSKGTTWIITDALLNSLSSLNTTTIESMEGVLGIRSYVPKSKNMENFKIRWNYFLLMHHQPNYTEKTGRDFIFYVRAYDTVWALATAIEKIQFHEVTRSYEKLNSSCAAITTLRISEAGPRLVKEILETRFLGLSGKFKLNNHGQIETPILEIFSIAGNGENSDITVGYWTAGRGLSRKVASAAEKDHKVVHLKAALLVSKETIWPGDSKLRVGVPNSSEFVNVQEIGDTKKLEVSGFCIDVFKAALDSLPFSLEPVFIPFVDYNYNGGSNLSYYDALVNKLSGTKTHDYDVVVGDVTIRPDRKAKVNFSLPYTESDVAMVVRAEPADGPTSMWIFLKPFSWDLWLTIVLATIFIGLVLRILERRVNPQRQLGMLLLFPVAALAFPERNMVGNSWARFVLVVWLFMTYILMQTYSANLSTILTVAQLRPSIDITCAGYNGSPFVKEILLLKLNITKCRIYSTMEEYDKALSLGCKNGGVDAYYDEIPYIRLFNHKYSPKYRMIRTAYDTGGFGFAFPTGSPLLDPISKAILYTNESGKIQEIEKRYFGTAKLSQYDAKNATQITPSLTSKSFAGLFIITAILTLLALVCAECSFAISRYRLEALEMTHDVR